MLMSFLGAILPAWGYHLKADFKEVGYYFLSLNLGFLLSVAGYVDTLDRHRDPELRPVRLRPPLPLEELLRRPARLPRGRSHPRGERRQIRSALRWRRGRVSRNQHGQSVVVLVGEREECLAAVA